METKLLIATALFVVIGLIAWGLFRRNRSTQSTIDFDDLLLGDDGRMSKSAAVLLGSFVLTSWIMFYLTVTGKMSEGYLTIYGGLWIVPTVATLISKTVVKTSEPEVRE